MCNVLKCMKNYSFALSLALSLSLSLSTPMPYQGNSKDVEKEKENPVEQSVDWAISLKLAIRSSKIQCCNSLFF